MDWEEIVQDYIIKHSDKIKRATKPLRDHLGVAYFTYHRIDREGKYTVLVDRPDWAEHYVEAQFYLDDPYLRHPDVYRSGFCLIESNGSEEYKKRILKDGKEIFNLDIGLIYIEKGVDCVEFFGFSGTKNQCPLEKIHLNHPQILKSFAAHFKNELGDILHQMEGESSSLLDLKGEDFLTNLPIHPDLSSEALIKYLAATGKKSEIAKALLLSPREKECILHLTSGRSAKETAFAMNLSPRTVESYLENIKTKLGCSTKQEIFSLAQSLQSLGLL